MAAHWWSQCMEKDSPTLQGLKQLSTCERVDNESKTISLFNNSLQLYSRVTVITTNTFANDFLIQNS